MSNRYEYVSAVPVNRLDPSGMEEIDQLPGFSDCCRTCNDALGLFSTGFTDVFSGEKRCPVRVECTFTGRRLAITERNSRNGQLTIKLNLAKRCWTANEMQLTLTHELQHASDFCAGRLPIKNQPKCSACWSTEFPAYVAECRLEFATEEEIAACAHDKTKRHCESLEPTCSYPDLDEVQEALDKLVLPILN